MRTGRTSEAVGFLCRWSLLAGAAAATVLVGWAAVRATASVGRNVRATLVMSDWVARPAARAGETARLPGCVQPPVAFAAPAALAVAEGRPLTIVRAHGGNCLAEIDDPREGITQVIVRGLPFSALAFEAPRCRLLCLPRDTRVFLVDARLALAQRREHLGGYHACLRAMDARGRAVLFHPGPREDYFRCLRALRAAGSDRAVLYADVPPGRTCTVRRARGSLCPTRRARTPEVVTADAGLARAAAAMGLPTHLVGCDRRPAKASGRLTCHLSLAKLKVSLSSRPIPPVR
jgi:hypothetical protein